ncbi:hypothetical protein ACN4EE_08200 [Geminocystis sp. CENA526]|uniref:hypothetical protein n=1 Tax=Geminocystis sp. CENA526 TaxID=1355871 RepID=UPI003D6EB392
MYDQLPNLLVISAQVPETAYSGSIVLYRLLESYPSDKLAVIGSPVQKNSKVLNCKYEKLKLPFQRLSTRTRFSRLIRSLRSLQIFPEFTISSITKMAKDFKPDVILSLMETQAYYHLAYRYAKFHQLPLVLIVHDIPETFEKVYEWAKEQQIKRNKEAYSYASKKLCVSPQMEAYLKEIYGSSGDVLYPHRSKNIKPRSPVDNKTLKQNDCLTIGYAGSLAYGYGEQLKKMIPVFKKTNAKLRIYSRSLNPLDSSDVVSYCGYTVTPEETWEKVQTECDAVILPYLWTNNQDLELLYRTHFPSKLSEYLALGMPILIFGPEYATGMQWGLQNIQSVLTITENNPDTWTEVLFKLRESPSLRTNLSHQAIMVGNSDFSTDIIQEQFINHIQDCFE